MSKLVFNLDAGYSTEVIGLFDMDLFAKGKVGARSLHIFNAADEPAGGESEAAEDEPQGEQEQAAPAAAGSIGKWFLVVLLMVASALATAVVMQKLDAKNADAASTASKATVSVHVPAPEETTIELNGKTIANGTTRPLDVKVPNKIKVTRAGFKPFEKTLATGTSGAVELHVALEPQK